MDRTHDQGADRGLNRFPSWRSIYRNFLDITFKSMKTAYATIKGFEVMRMFKKGQLAPWTYGQGLWGEIRLIHRQFGLYH
jgi:hypothetical protein